MKKLVNIATLIIICLLVSVSASAQKNKQVRKADGLYKEAKYSLAIPLYEEFLSQNAKKTNLATKTKLAYCYRMSNKQEKAEALYKQITELPKARPITFYYYGEILMANGKYAEAKKMFLEYDLLKPDDERGLLMAEACDKVKTIEPLLNGVDLQYLTINTDADDFSPAMYDDQLVFVSDQVEEKSLNFARKSEWTGRSFLKLLATTRGTEGIYSEVDEFSKRINILNKNSGPIVFTRDKQKAYFTRNSDVASKNNRYNMQIFETEQVNGKWKRGTVMEFCSPEYNFMHPAVSTSGDTIYFVSDRPNGFGGTDIYMTWKNQRGWQRPVSTGPVVNSPDHEGFPFIHTDGVLYFASKGHPGFGGFDIFKAELDEEGLYSTIKNLGQPINSTHDDAGFVLAPDGQSGYISSSRRADNDDIYYFKKYDIWIDGEVTDAKTQEPITNVAVEIKYGNKVKTVKTAPNGKFSYQVGLDEDYVIDIKIDGYEPFQQKITTKNFKKSTSITVTASLQNLRETKEDAKPISSDKVPEVNAVKKETLQEPVVILIVSVVDFQDKNLIKGVLLTMTHRETKSVKRTMVDTKGQAQLQLEPETEYLIKAEKKGYFAYTTVVDTRGKGVFETDTISLQIELKNIADNQTFQLDNIYYESGKFELTPDSKKELDKLVEILRNNPSMVIEVSSHTDSKGSDEYNLELSEKRALSAREYLILKGITPDRLKAKGYGETKLLNKCANGVPCTYPEHKLNRRTEVKVLKY